MNQRDIAGQIEDPTKWIFLIEGKNSEVHETVVASELAKKKGEFLFLQPEQKDLYR